MRVSLLQTLRLTIFLDLQKKKFSFPGGTHTPPTHPLLSSNRVDENRVLSITHSHTSNHTLKKLSNHIQNEKKLSIMVQGARPLFAPANAGAPLHELRTKWPS